MTVACRMCDEAFLRDTHLALHLVQDHPEAADAAEREAFDRAWAEEEATLRELRCHVTAGLVVLPMLVFYLGILLVASLGGVPMFLGLLLLPGVLGVGALTYHLTYSKARADLEERERHPHESAHRHHGGE